MRVIYDISVLGLGQYLRVARTGIYRVAEEQALGLLQADGCEVTFCSLDPLCNTFHMAGYLEDQEFFKTHGSSCVLYDSKIVRRFHRWRCSKGIHFPERVIAALYWASIPGTYALRKMEITGRIKRFVLDEARVFHTPHYIKIPAYIRERRHIRRFYAVHDLAFLKYPGYFRKNFLPYYGIQGVLGDLTGEDHVICVSESTKSDLLEYAGRVDPEKVSVVYPGVSGTLFPRGREEIIRVRRKYGIPEGPYALGVSTLEPRKNLPHLMDCFFSVVQEEKIGDLNLVLAGTKGWKYEEILQSTCRIKDLRHRVILTGFVPEEDLAPLYSGALFFVYPSLYEGFGLPPLEAMKCGTPVITSNVSSLPEVVGDGGLMVSPRDSDALCQAMVSLYRDESLRRKFSAKALERARNFSWGKAARETIDCYRRSLS